MIFSIPKESNCFLISLKSQFKSVDRYNSKFLTVLNDENLKNNELVIKDNKTKEEYTVKLDDLIDFLDEKLDESECSCGHCTCNE